MPPFTSIPTLAPSSSTLSGPLGVHDDDRPPPDLRARPRVLLTHDPSRLDDAAEHAAALLVHAQRDSVERARRPVEPQANNVRNGDLRVGLGSRATLRDGRAER